MTIDLAQWFAFGDQINVVYREELMRSASGPDVTGWLYHMVVGGHDLEWVRREIRKSKEWHSAHAPGMEPLPPADPPTLPTPPTAPTLPPGVLRQIKVTDAQDGELVNRAYSYWPNVWIDGGSIWVFVGASDSRPRLFHVDAQTGTVTRMPWPFPAYHGTTEGWYFDAEGWIYLLDGPRLHHVNPFSREDRIVFDISETHPNCRLWQAHSSDDGQTHCATVQRIGGDGEWPKPGIVTVQGVWQRFHTFPGVLDEAQIDPTGKWCVVKETGGIGPGLNNHILSLETGEVRTLTNQQGAVGHSDLEPGRLVGEWSPQPPSTDVGACIAWDLRGPLTLEHRQTLYPTWDMGHISCRGGCRLVSDSQHLIVVAPDGHRTWLIVHGMTVPPGTPEGKKYDYQVRANLDPTGRVGCYLTNSAGRLDAWLVVLP